MLMRVSAAGCAAALRRLVTVRRLRGATQGKSTRGALAQRGLIYSHVGKRGRWRVF